MPNRDFDTGKQTRPGEYKLTDRAYATLLNKIVDGKFANLTPALQSDILHFYDGSDAASPTKHMATVTKKDREELHRDLENIELLKSAMPKVESADNSETNH